MSECYISQNDLLVLADDLLSAGTQVIAPATLSVVAIGPASTVERVEYRSIQSTDELSLTGPLPRNSLKEFFLPATEPLLRWQYHKDEVELIEIATQFEPRVILGARPCDAAALEILDRVMDWDYHDELWFGRREATTVISLACPGVDESCFCTTLGSAPDSSIGADLLLVPASEGYRVEVHSPRGQRLVDAHSARFKETDEGIEKAQSFREEARAKVESNLSVDPKRIRSWLADHFEHPIWQELSLRCHGCGACAVVCPTCHCFDIVDELDGVERGTRRRNWDTCQTSKFTIHASGHNPRPTQIGRSRQRVMHKFYIYPERFDAVLCTGCGRCARVCGGGMDLPEILARLDEIAANQAKRVDGAL